ncbi:MAG TPA: MBL fold metallo-hydrolase [bacterium]|nr:MBL fold metallo-hydrolase [bacterium]
MISCTYIGHATALLKTGKTTLLTDPHFGKRTLFFPRHSPMPFHPSELPDVSAVLLSHTHYDHLDISSYKYVSCSAPIIVPEGAERAIGQYVPNPIIELAHYADHELACGTRVTAVPVVHRSSRISHLRFTRSNGYLVRNPDAGCVFFCADSAYGEIFAETGNLGKIDLALLPIGSYSPRWPMRRCHMTPAEAVRAFEDLGASHMVPIHHGTFKLSLEKPQAPSEWLRRIVGERPDLSARIHLLAPGESFVLQQ